MIKNIAEITNSIQPKDEYHFTRWLTNKTEQLMKGSPLPYDQDFKTFSAKPFVLKAEFREGKVEVFVDDLQISC